MSDDQSTPFQQEPAAPAAPAATPDPASAAPPAPQFQIPQTVAELIGEGKKYSTVEKALEALVHSQTHIEKLESENADFRTAAEKMRTQEELLEEIKATARPSEPNTPAPQVDEGMIDRIVEAKITAKEKAATDKQNVDTVVARMKKEYGDAAKAEEMYIAKAQELGLSIAQLNAMAAQSPTAVFSMFGLAKSEQAPAGKTHSDVNLESFNQKPSDLEKPKSVMGGASSKDLINAWNQAAPKQ